MSDLDPNDQLGQHEESRFTSEDIGGVTGMTVRDTRKVTKMNDPESLNAGVDDGTQDPRKPHDTRAARRTESVKKPKVPKTTRAAKKPNTDTKGDPATTKSFLDAFKTEPKCAAYLGYTDIAEYRKFQTK